MFGIKKNRPYVLNSYLQISEIARNSKDQEKVLNDLLNEIEIRLNKNAISFAKIERLRTVKNEIHAFLKKLNNDEEPDDLSEYVLKSYYTYGYSIKEIQSKVESKFLERLTYMDINVILYYKKPLNPIYNKNSESYIKDAVANDESLGHAAINLKPSDKSNLEESNTKLNAYYHLNAKEVLEYTIAYVFSRFTENNFQEAPHNRAYEDFEEHLNAESQDDVHQIIGEMLFIKKSLIKNRRDEFDPFFENGRKGWYQREPRKIIQEFITKYKNESYLNLKEFVIENLDRPVCRYCLENLVEIKGKKKMLGGRVSKVYRNKCSSCVKKRKISSTLVQTQSNRSTTPADIIQQDIKNNEKYIKDKPNTTVTIISGVYSGMSAKFINKNDDNSVDLYIDEVDTNVTLPEYQITCR